MPKSQFVSVLDGAVPFSDGNVNDTFRGQVLRHNGETIGAILKDLEIKELGNELLVFHLADQLGLAVPEIRIAVDEKGILSARKGPKTREGHAIILASIDAYVPSLRARLNATNPAAWSLLYNELIGWERLGEMYALDAWVANIDRHQGNILFGPPQEFWMIDHGHCFSGPKWNAADLKSAGDYVNRLKQWLSPNMTEEEKRKHNKVVSEVSSAAQNLDVDALIDETVLNSLLLSTDLDALKEFLKVRKQFIQQKAADALGLLV